MNVLALAAGFALGFIAGVALTCLMVFRDRVEEEMDSRGAVMTGFAWRYL
jgi:hypothetical protein